MKLISCRISGFGKLRDKTIEFTEGENRFSFENGAGKTTLAEFLCAMFYGFSKSDKNDRERFCPWVGEIYGGELCFSVGEACYRLNRTFGKTPKLDVFSLRDMTTNQLVSDYSEAIGKELFLMDRKSFRNTIFFGQQKLCSEMTDDIRMILGQEASENSGYGDALERLKEAENELTGKRGSIASRSAEIEKINRELKQKERLLSDERELASDLSNLTKEQTDLTDSLNSLNEQEKQLSEQIGEAENASEKMLLLETLSKAETDYEDALDRFPGEVPEPEKWEKLGQNSRKLIRLRETLSELQNNGENERNSYGKESWDAAFLTEKKKRHFLRFTAGILGILLLVLAVTAPSWEQSEHFAFGIAGFCILLAVLVPVLFGLKKTEAVLRNLTKQKRFSGEKDISRSRISELAAEAEEEERKLRDAFSEYGIEPDTKIADTWDSLREVYEEIQVTKQTCGKLAESWETRFGDLTEQNRNDVRNAYENRETLISARKEAEHLIREKRELLDGLPGKIREKNGILNDTREELALLYDRERELEKLEESQEHDRKLAGMIQKTETFLQLAKDRMALRYTEPLTDRLTELVSQITDDVPELFLDTDGNITKTECGMQRALDTQSAGLKDLLVFCERLSYAEAMFPDEKPFLVLDDPFVNLDTGKRVRAEQLLGTLSRTFQILYFTANL